MFKNIIFDLGNVLLDFNPIEHLGKYLSEQQIQSIYPIIFKSEEWLMLDRGILTESEAIAIFSERYPVHKQLVERVFEDWYDMLQPIGENVEALTRLKEEGYKLYYLSNFHHAAFEEMVRRHAFFAAFDGGVVSYQVKMLKPEQEIYQELLSKHDLKASECLFVDDTKKNVDAAYELGIEGIWLESQQELTNQLVAKNVLKSKIINRG